MVSAIRVRLGKSTQKLEVDRNCLGTGHTVGIDFPEKHSQCGVRLPAAFFENQKEKKMSASVTINGKTYSGTSSVIMSNNNVIIDGILQQNDVETPIKIEIIGSLQSLSCDKSVEVEGKGIIHHIEANSVNCGNVSGGVNAKGSISCRDIDGRVQAGGSINCNRISM